MATDSGTTTADAPPPPPPPPPPAESSNQRIADIGSSRTGDGGRRTEPQGLETPGLRPTPEFQQQLDTFREDKDAARQPELTPQQSADLGSSRIEGGDYNADPPASEPAAPSLRPTSEVQQQLDTFPENKDTARQPELTPEQSAGLGSSRVEQAPVEQGDAHPDPEPSQNPITDHRPSQEGSQETLGEMPDGTSSEPESTSADTLGGAPHPETPQPRDDVATVELNTDAPAPDDNLPEQSRGDGDAARGEPAALTDDAQPRVVDDHVWRPDGGQASDHPGGRDDQPASDEPAYDVESADVEPDTTGDEPDPKLDEASGSDGGAGGGPPEPPEFNGENDRPPPPDANGYLGHAFEANTIRVGDILDRYGDENGRWLSPAGTSLEDRALPQGHSNGLNSYLVVRELPAEVTQGVTATYLEPGGGGGIQYVLPQGRTVQDYIADGYLVKLSP